MDTIVTKKCSKCGKEKELSCFTRAKNQKSGLRPSCKECERKRHLEYRDRNGDEIRARFRKYYSENKEKETERKKASRLLHKDSEKRYRETNSERIKKRQKEYRQNNRELVLERNRDWCKRNPELKSAQSERRRSREKQAPGLGVSGKQWRAICKMYDYSCAYCGSKEKIEMDHVIPLSKGGRHETENVVPSCKSCNCSKQNKSVLDFLKGWGK